MELALQSDIISLYKDGYGLRRISKLLNVPETRIKDLAMKQGIARTSRGEANARKAELRHRRVESEGLKKCSICNEIKPTADFYKKQSRVGPWCKECHKNESKTRRQTYKERGLCIKCRSPIEKGGGLKHCQSCAKGVRDQRRGVVKKCIDYLGRKCSVCSGEFHPASMDFHHKNPEEKDIKVSSLMSLSNWERIKQELDKCMLVCSNCHRVLHYKED